MAIESNQIRQKTVWAEDSNPLPDLPHEIIVDILSRLPVKTLLRLKCVCKSWRSLISHPKFAQTHLSLASSNINYTHHRLLLRGLYLPFYPKSCSIFSIMYEQFDIAVSLDPVSLDHYPSDGTSWFCIVGSCNGLLCFTFQNKTVFLWNPSTRKSRKLPSTSTLLDKYMGNSHPVYGFGYDELIDDYKVVLISETPFNRECQRREVEVHVVAVVYTLRNNSWRRIGDCPYNNLAGSGKFASGVLHWTAIVEGKEIILSLDLVKETYGEVSQPDYEDGYFDSTMDVLGGCLCMLCTYIGVGVDVWVMKEYGIRESWTKLVAIHDVTNPLYGYCFTPRCILKNGDILMEVMTRLVRYNPKDGTFSYPKINHECFPPFNVYPYIESLVSPDTDAGARIEWQHQY